MILCNAWFGLTETAAVTAVAINKIPNVATTLREGMRASSRDLAEMATVYRFSPWARVRHLVLPTVVSVSVSSIWYPSCRQRQAGRAVY